MMTFYAGLDESDLKHRFAYFSEQQSRGQNATCQEEVQRIAHTILQNWLRMPPQLGKDQDFLCLAADGHLEKAEAMLDNAPKNRWASLTRFQPAALTLARAFNRCGMSGLHFAAQSGTLSFAAKLILSGSEIDPINLMQETPLMLAAEAGHADLVAGLLIAGATAEAQDIYGQTALMRTCKKGHLSAAYALLAHTSAAASTVTDIFGYDALDYAIEARCHPLTEALTQHIRQHAEMSQRSAKTKTLPQLGYA